MSFCAHAAERFTLNVCVCVCVCRVHVQSFCAGQRWSECSSHSRRDDFLSCHKEQAPFSAALRHLPRVRHQLGIYVTANCSGRLFRLSFFLLPGTVTTSARILISSATTRKSPAACLSAYVTMATRRTLTRQSVDASWCRASGT